MEVISAVQRSVSRGQCRCASARTIAAYKSTSGSAIAVRCLWKSCQLLVLHNCMKKLYQKSTTNRSSEVRAVRRLTCNKLCEPRHATVVSVVNMLDSRPLDRLAGEFLKSRGGAIYKISYDLS